MMHPPSNENTRVIAVTVTYASRRPLLMQALQAASRERVHAIVVVDNGSDWDVKELEQLPALPPITVISLPSNVGSAGGFSAGMRVACQMNAEFAWILDDDNVPSEGCLAALLSRHKLEEPKCDGITAMLAYRPEHQPLIATNAPKGEINHRRSSFLGFHVLDLPRKIWRRSKLGALERREPGTDPVRLDYAPYSGMLIRLNDLIKIGFPREDFILYADDSEWSYRITATGGRILLLPEAKMEDIESSWNVKEDFGSSMAALLMGPGDARAYYAARNSTFFFNHSMGGSRAMKALNRAVYLLILSAMSARLRAQQRHSILKRAITDGLAGKLGKSGKFSL
ncbi:glycosyltransferase [Stenotrophomonas maltophilia]|uniref:glycosyltransferase n=1 Tax=Stenotrophomonas maltophilia TaxID=40324 RepID=UPI00080B329F|nr:glycosyltransferase [Stenotrophomonas maltophilia]